MVRSLCGTNPNTLPNNSIMETKIPQEIKLILIGHMEGICNLQGKVEDEDFMLILMELCKGAFIAGQKTAIDELRMEFFK